MMPNGPIPLPPVMNFGMPSLAPLVPPPTLLVPYPVIVPLPVPIPIPIPIPFNSKSTKDQPESSGSVCIAPETSESSASRAHTPVSSRGEKGEQKTKPAGSERLSPVRSERNKTTVASLTVKAEDNSGSLCLTSGSGLIDGVIDLTMGQRPCQQQVIQKMLPGVQGSIQVKVKVEAEAESRSPAELVREGKGDSGERAFFSPSNASELEGVTHLSSSSNNSNPSSKSDTPGNQLNPSIPNLTMAPLPPSVRTHPLPLPQLQVSPAASCNVIVNGTGWHSLLTPAFESCPDRQGDKGGGDGEAEDQPSNGDLEHEALKENNCSVGEREVGKRILAQDEKVNTVEGKPDPESSMEEGEHAYALPLLSAGGCVVIQPVPKSSAEKTAILSCSITAPLAAAGSPELEPPLKRRCLRIRNQNK